jgi:hypothetical protein
MRSRHGDSKDFVSGMFQTYAEQMEAEEEAWEVVVYPVEDHLTQDMNLHLCLDCRVMLKQFEKELKQDGKWRYEDPWLPT